MESIEEAIQKNKEEKEKNIGVGGEWPKCWALYERAEEQPRPHIFWLHENRRFLVLPVEKKFMYLFKSSMPLSEDFDLDKMKPGDFPEKIFVSWEALRDFVGLYKDFVMR